MEENVVSRDTVKDQSNEVAETMKDCQDIAKILPRYLPRYCQDDDC